MSLLTPAAKTTLARNQKAAQILGAYREALNVLGLIHDSLVFSALADARVDYTAINTTFEQAVAELDKKFAEAMAKSSAEEGRKFLVDWFESTYRDDLQMLNLGRGVASPGRPEPIRK